MNLGQVSPEIAEGFGTHRSSSTSSRDAAGGSPHGAAQGRAGLFDDLIDALAAGERRTADDDPAEQTSDGGIVPFQLPLMPQDAAPPAQTGDVSAKTAASDQAPVSAAEAAITDAIDAAAQAQASSAHTAAGLPIAPPPASKSAVPGKPATSHAEAATQAGDQQTPTPTLTPTPIPSPIPTEMAGDAPSVPPTNEATVPDALTTNAPATSVNQGAGAHAAPSQTTRSEHAQRRDSKGRTASRAATHRATQPVSVGAADAHAARAAAIATPQGSGTERIHVSRAQVRLMNAQTPVAATDNVHISVPFVDSASDAAPPPTETAATSVEPASVSPAKDAALPAASLQTIATAAVQVPTPAAAGETESTAGVAPVARREAASAAAPVETTRSQIDALRHTEPEPTTRPQESVAAAAPTVTSATAKPAPATPPRSAHAEGKRQADAPQQTATVSRRVINQPATEEAGERSVATTEVRSAQIEDVPSQEPATNTPANQSTREERPVRTAEARATSTPARDVAQPSLDLGVQARPETAQRLLERAIASQQPADSSRGPIAAAESPPLAAGTSTAAPGQPAADQSATGGQHPHEDGRDRASTSATPIERASSAVRRPSDPREAPEMAAPAAASATSRGPTVLHMAAPALLSPQLAEVAPTTTASATTASSPLAPDTADRIVQSMRLQYQRGGGDAVLQIRPEHLGPVTISLRVENGVVSAVVSAEHPATAEWLQSNQQSLKESLQQSGLQLERFVVQRDGQSPSDRQRREWSDARRRDVRRRAPQQDSTFEITI
jgi:flagellar hook-length control protein FliK